MKELMLRACGGDTDAMVALAARLASFSGIHSTDAALYWAAKAEEEGSVEGAMTLARLVLERRSADQERALACLQRHTDASPKAALMLGRILYFGEYDVPPDTEDGLRLIERARRAGLPEAAYTIGIIQELNSKYEEALRSFLASGCDGFILGDTRARLLRDAALERGAIESEFLAHEFLQAAERQKLNRTTQELAHDAAEFYAPGNPGAIPNYSQRTRLTGPR